MITEPTLLKLVNQLHEIKKHAGRENLQPVLRACSRVNNYLEEEGIIVHDPTGEAYETSRTDCEANLMVDNIGSMVISESIKPAVYAVKDGNRNIIQRAVVIVGGEKK